MDSRGDEPGMNPQWRLDLNKLSLLSAVHLAAMAPTPIRS
jgi:hypothetical protein